MAEGASKSSVNLFWSAPALVTLAQPSTASNAVVASPFAAVLVVASNRL